MRSMSSPAREPVPGPISSPGRYGLTITRFGSRSKRWGVRATRGLGMSVEFQPAARAIELLVCQRQHLDEREEKADRALGSLIQVGRCDPQPVSATGRREIVNGGVQPIGAEEPGERLVHPAKVVILPRRQEGRSEG